MPLNALRAFEVSARHLSFTRAGMELCVTQAAVSHQVKCLEKILGVPLFRRLPRGLALTDEGLSLLPVLADSFARIGATLDRFENGRFREVVTIGVVGTFAAGWLLPRLPAFSEACPHVDLRLLTNNNRVDMAGEGLDYAIRFGDGSWHGTDAAQLFAAPLAPVCVPAIADRLGGVEDLRREVLLRSYRADEWARWFSLSGFPGPVLSGPVFDSSVIMAEAALQGLGVALLPVRMFRSQLSERRLIRPFPQEVEAGGYWLTALKSKRESAGMKTFRDWLTSAAAADDLKGLSGE